MVSFLLVTAGSVDTVGMPYMLSRNWGRCRWLGLHNGGGGDDGTYVLVEV